MINRRTKIITLIQLSEKNPKNNVHGSIQWYSDHPVVEVEL